MIFLGFENFNRTGRKMKLYNRGLSPTVVEAAVTDVRRCRVIDDRGFIGLTDYAYLNNLSRTTASLELKKICADENTPIRSMGQHSHKVWVRRKE